ncbi:hypothetical protein BC826DRAFT_1107219 [Russula brevipes]|nr:hypothetical protein BC826DRAFT_1107219 [Russula brevipes]
MSELVHFNKYMQLYGLLRSCFRREERPTPPSWLEDLLDDAGEHSLLDFVL